MANIKDQEVEANWNWLCNNHVLPTRMVGVALHSKTLTAWESKHLRECERCRWWMNHWLEITAECPDCGCPSDGRCKECDDELGAGE